MKYTHILFVITLFPSVSVMLLLFRDLFEKKGAIDFQKILFPLSDFRSRFQNILFSYAARDSHKSVLAVFMSPVFKSIVFSDIDFAILIAT